MGIGLSLWKHRSGFIKSYGVMTLMVLAGCLEKKLSAWFLFALGGIVKEEYKMTEFVSFPKIARYSRNVVVTEKLMAPMHRYSSEKMVNSLTGSRNRWITPEDDNYGFSRWAHEHKDELLTLGPGRHFGEWWGNGIQRGLWAA